jgi:uncharacterized caspase-like protein
MRRIATVLALVFFSAFPLFAGTRGIAVEKAVADGTGWGDFYALIVGINDYQEWNPLQTAVKDATALKEILVDRYGFAEDRVVLLTDKEASRGRIVQALRNLAAGLKKTDNLLIYYAGHGQVDDLTGDGYWIPAEGKLKDTTTWVSHSTVKSILSSESVRAKNVVLVADACYSGTLLREGPSTLAVDRGDYVDKLRAAAAKPSRQVITSGGMEPVADGGKDGHSLFAYYFLKALKENDREVIDLENLFHTRVWEPVTEIGHQRPNVGRLQTPMDDDGQFVLTNLAAARARVKKAEAEKQQILEQQQWQTQLEEERARIESEKRRLAQEKELLAQRRELELEKLKVEQEKQRLALDAEKARLDAERRAMALETEKAKTAAPRESMQTAALSAPAPRPVGRLPLKIALMPWRFKPSSSGGGAQVINDRTAFNFVLETLSEKERFSVSHSYYDFDPPPETIEGPIPALELGRDGPDAVWKKKSFFSRPEPDINQTVLLAEKFGFDIAIFINEWYVDDEILQLTLVDAATREKFVFENNFNYLTFEETLHRALDEKLREVIKNRAS